MRRGERPRTPPRLRAAAPALQPALPLLFALPRYAPASQHRPAPSWARVSTNNAGPPRTPAAARRSAASTGIARAGTISSLLPAADSLSVYEPSDGMPTAALATAGATAAVTGSLTYVPGVAGSAVFFKLLCASHWAPNARPGARSPALAGPAGSPAHRRAPVVSLRAMGHRRSRRALWALLLVLAVVVDAYTFPPFPAYPPLVRARRPSPRSSNARTLRPFPPFPLPFAVAGGPA